jgi:glycosyltransferase involved in cell wall biosynthesis
MSDDTKVLTVEAVRLPANLASRTTVLPETTETWWERGLRKVGLQGWAWRSRALRRAWALYRASRRFEVVVSAGDTVGGFFAALLRLRGGKRPVHVMYDCLWYGGGWLRRVWTRFCLRQVDRCIVWASVECERYAGAYGVPREKFLYVPHHDTLHARYSYELGDEGYIFTGGNADRDYGLFFAAVRDVSTPCVLATNQPRLLAGLTVPANVKVVSVSPSEFRQLMARSRLVVVPMQANLLHAGGQQTVLNAMKMGKPVILTDPEGGVDYIENGRTGVLVPYGEAAALRSAIEHLLTHAEEARAMGRCAQAAASLMTTERCCNTIWNHALQLAEKRVAENEGAAAVGNAQSQGVD